MLRYPISRSTWLSGFRVTAVAGRSPTVHNPVHNFVNSFPAALPCQTFKESRRQISNATELLTHVVPKATHSCGALTARDVQKKVVLCGWLSSSRELGKDLQFLALRDGHGITQITPEMKAEWEKKYGFSSIPLESVLAVTGTVVPRPADQVNPKMSTGEIEVEATSVEVLNFAENLPFSFNRQSISVGEETLMKYRYLDLRQPNLQHNIRLRSKVSKAVRDFLHNQGFIEIETPTLFKSTPEGAREFLVATRIPGKFYSLPQSPQQYKQLLMISGFEKYFQIARCYRDESGRKDRQPEFTQIDMEMAFIRQEDIMQVIEGLVTEIWKAAGVAIQTPFIRMKHRDALENYGTDRPDTRFGFLLQNLTDVFAGTGVGIIQKSLQKRNARVTGLNMKGFADHVTKNDLNFLIEEAKSVGAEGVMIVQVDSRSGEWKSGITKHLSENEKLELTKRLNVENGDLLFLSADERKQSLITLGRMRNTVAPMMAAKGLLPEFDDTKYNFLWVIDFPLFAKPEADSVVASHPDGLVAEHHPFTAPRPEDIEKLDTAPEEVIAQHYDIVVNGMEIGGGSIRIHRPEMQLKVLRDILKLSPSRLKTFDHLISALGHGAPPHGGIALGFDRLISILTQSTSLRSVIAFPKTAQGVELMTGSPSEVEKKQLDEVHIQVKPPK